MGYPNPNDMRLQISHFLISLGVIFAVPNALSAQESWSLGACIEYAKVHNLDIQKGRNGLLLAKVDEQQSELAFLPTLNLNGGYYWNFGLTIDPITNTRQPGSRQTLGTTASSNCCLLYTSDAADE